MATYRILGIDTTTGQEGLADTGDTVVPGGGVNIYNADGTLTATRAVAQATFPLAFSGGDFSAGYTGATQQTVTITSSFARLNSINATNTSRVFTDTTASGLVHTDTPTSQTNILQVTPTGVALSIGSASDLKINAAAGTVGQVLTSAGAGLPPAWATASGTNIYTADGTLLGNRTVNQGANSLTFNSAVGLQASSFTKSVTSMSLLLSDATPGLSSTLNMNSANTTLTFSNTAEGTTSLVLGAGKFFRINTPGTGAININGAVGLHGQVIAAQKTGLGADVAPLWTPPGLLGTATSVNLKTASATTLFTVPTGSIAIITACVVRITSATAITVGATAGLGFNGTQDNIFAPQVMTGVLATADMWTFNALGKAVIAPAGSVIQIGVDVVATGTAQSATVHLFGFCV